jgi:hypothetical protein
MRLEYWPVSFSDKDGFNEVAENSPDIHAWGIYERLPNGIACHLVDVETKDLVLAYIERHKKEMGE